MKIEHLYAHYYKEFGSGLWLDRNAAVVKHLAKEVNERDEFIQRMLVVMVEIAPAATLDSGMEAPAIRKYET